MPQNIEHHKVHSAPRISRGIWGEIKDNVHALEYAQAPIRDKYNLLAEKFELNEKVSPEKKLIEVLISPETKTNLTEYFLYALQQDISTTSLKGHKAILSVPTNMASFLNGDIPNAYIKDFFGRVDDIMLVDPFSELPKESPSIEEIKAMKSPLSEEQRKKLDTIFTKSDDPSDEQDIDQMLLKGFLIGLSLSSGLVINKQQQFVYERKKISAEAVEQVNKLGLIMQDYIGGYYDKFVQELSIKNTTADTLLVENSLLPVALGVKLFATETDLLPVNFNTLMTYIPGLGDDCTNLLVQGYQKRFNDTQGELFDRPNDQGLTPYKMIEKSYATGKTLNYINFLSKKYSVGAPQLSEQEVFLNNFDKIAGYLEGIIFPLEPNEGMVSLDISTHGKGKIIDFLFLSARNEMLALQIDQKGRVFGIPQEFEGDARGIISYALQKAVSFLQNERVIPRQKEIVKQSDIVQRSANETVYSQQKTSVEPAPQEKTIIKAVTKRKALRRLGFESEKETRRDKEQNLTPLPEEKYLKIELPEKVLKDLPFDVQEKIKRAVEKVRMYGLEIKSVTRMRRVANKMEDAYRIRVGDYRAVFDYDANKNEGVVLLVGSRKNIYNRLARQLGLRKLEI